MIRLEECSDRQYIEKSGILGNADSGRQYDEASRLLEAARQARAFSYAPYSHFTVGAALLCSDGSIVSGCNIENAAYSPGNCAERTAVFKAISEGKRSFQAIAIVGAKEEAPYEESLSKELFSKESHFREMPSEEMPSVGVPCTPCGVCRQVLAEFCRADSFWIYVTDGQNIFAYTLEELLPSAFGAAQL